MFLNCPYATNCVTRLAFIFPALSRHVRQICRVAPPAAVNQDFAPPLHHRAVKLSRSHRRNHHQHQSTIVQSTLKRSTIQTVLRTICLRYMLTILSTTATTKAVIQKATTRRFFVIKV